MPDEETVKKVYDNLDFSRGVEAFLSGMPAASLYTMCTGFEKAGISAHTIAISEELLDAFNPEITGLFASIGIKKGQPFALLRSAAVAVVRSGSLLALRTRTSSIESWLIFATRIQPPPPCRY